MKNFVNEQAFENVISILSLILFSSLSVNILRLKLNGHYFADGIFIYILLNKIMNFC